MGYRVGVDVGGTFTDLICVDDEGRVLLDKTPTTPEDQSIGMLDGLNRLAGTLGLEQEELCAQIDVIVHGTTVADNTMIEMSGANTGMLVTEGHRDEIEMRRVHKEKIWDPTYPAPPPIARRRARIPIPERCGFDGSVLLALDEEAVRQGVRRLRQLGVRSIAVVFLFSFVNPAHEQRAARIIDEEYPDVEHVSLSHEVLPRGPEFERTSTTLLNAYLAPGLAGYLASLGTRLDKAGYHGPLLVMQSTGGVMPPTYVARRAVSLLGSGPTGGVMGAALAAERAGERNFVTADVGGTSFDVCLVRNGVPEVKTDWNWRYRYYVGLPMVDVQSVGAGGGSIARVRQGALLVGPDSAGAVPGPACYGRGGTAATVTDADALLGYLDPTGFAGGRMALDLDAAHAAIARDVADPLGMDVTEAAWGIERIVNANMANATRRVLSGYGADPRDLSLIAFGGNGGVHAWEIAAELGISRVLVPRAAPAFSALGVLVADYAVDLIRSYVAPLSQVDVEHLGSLFDELEAECAGELASAGDSAADPAVAARQRFVQMAYAGQNFDLSVPVPDDLAWVGGTLMDLAARFHTLHEADRGFAFPEQEPVVRGVRVTSRHVTPKPPHLDPALVAGHGTDAADASPGPAPSRSTPAREVWFGDGWLDTRIIDGPGLVPGSVVAGPAVIEEPFTAVVIPPNRTAYLDANGHYAIQ